MPASGSRRASRTASVAPRPQQPVRASTKSAPTFAHQPTANIEDLRLGTGLPSPTEVVRLQGQFGNQAVMRLLRAPAPPAVAAGGHLPTGVAQRNHHLLADGTAAPVEAAKEPAADEVVLSSAAAYATVGFVPWFQGKIKDTATAWGLAFTPANVSCKKVLLDGTATEAIVLKWDTAWGSRPKNNPTTFTFEPVDARMAVSGAHAVPGWAKVPGADQIIIDNLLGGETNQWSKAARTHLRAQMADLKTKSAAEQGKALRAMITDAAAEPGVVAEPVSTTSVEHTLEGPTEIAEYEFRGVKAAAESYVAKFKDGVNVTIVAPKALVAGFHNHTVQKTAESAGYLPKAARKLITTVMLNAVTNPDDPHWSVEYKTPDFHSYMTAGVAGIVTIYPDKIANALPDDNYRHGTMVHETGHTWSYKTWGTDTAKGKWVDWKAAMDKDKTAVSGYARNSISEDVAETIQVYVTTKGAPRHEEYKAMVPARFAILAAEYST